MRIIKLSRTFPVTIYDRHNPLDGLSASQIILLFERGSRQKLNEPLRNIAIDTINQHQDAVKTPTLESTMKSMFEQSELEEFAAISAEKFFGESLLDKKFGKQVKSKEQCISLSQNKKKPGK